MNALPLLAAVALTSSAAPAPNLNGQWATDMSGLWQVSSRIGGAALTIDCNVLQLGAALYGSCEPEAQGATPTALSGQINGARASWGYDLQDQGRILRLQYQATVVSSAQLNGTLTYSGVPSAFTAARK